MTLDTIYNDIPRHSELKGARYKLSGGSYYATAPHSFMVYAYGTHGVSIDSSDYYYSYASPAAFGMTPIYTKISVRVDTFPTSWKVCIYDSTFGYGGGIKSVILMDDEG